jgi:hypothetical protein
MGKCTDNPKYDKESSDIQNTWKQGETDNKKLEGESIADWLKRVSIKDSKWLEEFKYRQENAYWVDSGFTICVSVLSFLRENKIDKKEFEQLCGFPLILKGSHDWKLSEIKRLELLLNKKLL